MRCRNLAGALLERAGKGMKILGRIAVEEGRGEMAGTGGSHKQAAGVGAGGRNSIHWRNLGTTTPGGTMRSSEKPQSLLSTRMTGHFSAASEFCKRE
jgi:hypothetical protein